MSVALGVSGAESVAIGVAVREEGSSIGVCETVGVSRGRIVAAYAGVESARMAHTEVSVGNGVGESEGTGVGVEVAVGTKVAVGNGVMVLGTVGTVVGRVAVGRGCVREAVGCD